MTLNEMPLVTVLMSCYNAAKWLDESIPSILQQTYSNFEFLIIDDGSEDTTYDVLEIFAKKDHRIKIFKKSNTGLADSLNVGLYQARGKWIARMDADDISELNRLEKQVAYAQNHTGVVYVGSDLRLIDSDGNFSTSYQYPINHNSLLNNLLISKPFPPHSSAFYLCALARNLGGYRRKILRAEDWDLWLRLSEKGLLSSIPEPLVRIRKHPDQISLSSGGRESIIDSRISIASYLLRKNNFSDPVNLNEHDFKQFYDLIDQRLREERYFDYCDWKIQLKESFKKSLYCSFFYRTLKNPLFLIRLIFERYRGHHFGSRFIKTIIKREYLYYVIHNKNNIYMSIICIIKKILN
jgi:glycosyltransferase involved in cell wall biosynthesis